MKNNIKTAASIGLIALALSLSACGKKATGQVVAVVNDEEITLEELSAELNGVSIPENADKKLAMRQLLQQVIDRRLLAQAAKEQGLDRDPVYITQQRRANEDLLVRLYAKKASDSIPVPDAAAIAQYIAAHPQMFSGRTRYKLDQLRFTVPTDPAQIKALEANHSLDEIAATLTKFGIKSERGNGALDTGATPPATLKQILSLPPGEPFITPSGQFFVASVIVGQDPVMVPAAQTRPLAVQSIRDENLNKIGETRLKEARAAAKIDYQPGYEAPTNKSAAAKK